MPPTPTPTPTIDARVLYIDGKLSFLRRSESTTLPALRMGGSGDPHMILRIDGGPIIARWDDNKPGSEGEEILFFHVKTSDHDISVFYTKGGWGDPGAKIISSVRVIHNNNMTIYNDLFEINVGPISVSGGSYDLELSMNSITGVLEYGGAAFIALEAATKAKGYVDGGWGYNVDGYANFANGTCTGCVGPTTLQPNQFIVGQGVTIGQDYSVTVVGGGNLSTDNKEPRKLLKAIDDNFIGFNAMQNNLPLDPVALQQADMAAPGGDFDGLINPPGVTGGIINAQGDRGPGLAIYGNNGIPQTMASVGTHYPSIGPVYMNMKFSKNVYRRLSK